ncbi:hypothetical protein AA0313_1881 [Acetobacter indonesiensis NRIC 0313]|uniref:Uncharacterized protein n=1 Tax=Acetobacter indonesiensis TaxID=104101 RepID=A0A6N3T6D8_9PROT|nr:hypothetical protein [Acetobacter indonesiensis]GAN62524.1 hypothetical protein Abin_008_030 [Acetobacter indonesiensis]GBQ58729.1 hypothetical protein AA0313_1881 [Acetobacter indonesiensis NRIC 0313]GEN04891.1 hypothetical protein AIN02nite_29160 [Acetobacter indonesiensis]
MSIVETPDPPYYSVIFTSVRTKTSDGYDETALKMVRQAESLDMISLVLLYNPANIPEHATA